MMRTFYLASALALSSSLAFATPQNPINSLTRGAAQSGGKGGPAADCNDNGIADDIDIQNGTSSDCNNDGIPDECPVCPPVDVVFIMDTSGSMSDEGNALCNSINGVVSDLLTQGIQVNASFYGITTLGFSCLQGTVANELGTSVPGSTPQPDLNHLEDWGPATSIVSDRFNWTPGSVRVIVPISDEGSQNGNPNNTADTDAILNAIEIAVANGVICSPISGTGSTNAVIQQAADLAAGTGGMNFISSDPDLDLAGAIAMLLTDACVSASDCNDNGIPDECDQDSNGNGIPDECEDGNSELDCSEFDRYEDLTPNDTLTLLTSHHNPSLEQGYVQVVAVDNTNQPIAFDHLIGNSIVINGFEAIDYSLNPVDYRAAVAQGQITDVDGDGIRDLNGIEYEQTAGQILIPRFFGQDSTTNGQLLFISLAGGRKFDTTVDLLVSNDNEVTFSSEYTFRCWDKVSLTSISTLFTNEFLQNYSGDDADENLDGRESGWILMDGGVANSMTMSIPDPAFYSVYIERINNAMAADLPFETCTQSGHLLPNALFGDNEEAAGELPQDCDANISRRRPGSFLLYPEFDNVSGKITILTVTNTSAQESVRAHFVYVGRFGL
ncbi:MAG: hypothetical protein ACI9F9_000226 [Candidatus Paceibacteria bacterium]|jgi:hypothetical protein